MYSFKIYVEQLNERIVLLVFSFRIFRKSYCFSRDYFLFATFHKVKESGLLIEIEKK